MSILPPLTTKSWYPIDCLYHGWELLMNVYFRYNDIGCMTKDVLDGAEGDIHHIEIGCTGMPTIVRRMIHSMSGAEFCEEVKNLCVLVLLSCIFGDQVFRAFGEKSFHKRYNTFSNGNCPVCSCLCFHFILNGNIC